MPRSCASSTPIPKTRSPCSTPPSTRSSRPATSPSSRSRSPARPRCSSASTGPTARPRCTRRSSANPAATTTSPTSRSSPDGSGEAGRRGRSDESATGAAMDLSDAAHYARQEIQTARVPSSATPRERAGAARRAQRREVEVLRLAAEGLTTAEIADRLYISAKTADRHIQHIYTKIGASNRAAATLWAVEQGLARLSDRANGENSDAVACRAGARSLRVHRPERTGDSDDPRHHAVRRLGPLLDRLQHRRRREARRARLQGRAACSATTPRLTASGSLFDWDDAGWQSFVTDPTVPPVMKDAGHLDQALHARLPRRDRGLRRRHDIKPDSSRSVSSPTSPARCPSWAPRTPTWPTWSSTTSTRAAASSGARSS